MGKQPMDRLMVEMDVGLSEFLRTQMDSFIKWHLIEFFYQNPNVIDTTHNLARYIGRRAEDVSEEVAELARGGMLATEGVDGQIVYSLSADPEVRSLVRRFVDGCDDHLFRIAGVCHVLRRMRCEDIR